MSRLKKLNVTPMSDYVAILPDEEVKFTATGLIIPESENRAPIRGIVLAKGSGRVSLEGPRLPMEVKIGDLVTYARRSGIPQKTDGIDYLLMREIELLSIIGRVDDVVTIEVTKGIKGEWFENEVGNPYRTYDDGSEKWEVEIGGIKNYIPRANAKVIQRVEAIPEYENA